MEAGVVELVEELAANDLSDASLTYDESKELHHLLLRIARTTHSD